jgi:hypothetical protein
MMVGVFAAKERNSSLSADADAAASLMSLAFSLHELGHYYLANKAGAWNALVQPQENAYSTRSDEFT